MSATTEEVTVDLAALDAAEAEKAKKEAGKGDKKPETAASEPEVVVDPEVTAQKGASEVLTPEKGLETLRKQLKDEQEARQAAEARAREAAQAEAEARGRVQTTELDLVKNAIANVTQANDALESKYADALAAQDWGAAAKIQRQMADNSAKLARLEEGKARIEQQPKPTPRVPADPVEQYIASIGPEYPRSREWLRAHPEFVRDPHKNRQMIAAHELAVARGYKADTDEYFRSIEKTLDLTPPPAGTNGAGNGAHSVDADPLAESAAVATGGRQAAPVAAPVSRSGTGNGSRPNVMRLSPEEVEIAQNMGMTPEEYARNKLALKKEGKLS